MADTTFHLGRPAASTTEFISRATAIVGTIVMRLNDALERKRTIAALKGLSDSRLDDLGIIRGDIERRVANS